MLLTIVERGSKIAENFWSTFVDSINVFNHRLSVVVFMKLKFKPDCNILLNRHYSTVRDFSKVFLLSKNDLQNQQRTASNLIHTYCSASQE